MSTVIGVLSLQGAVREHEHALAQLGVETRKVRRPRDLDGLDGLVFPGGESTTMSKLLNVEGMRDPVQQALDGGLPAFGTCAGMILLADVVRDTREDAVNFHALDVTVRRNAFGRQVDSFETDLDVAGIEDAVHAVFIRAPWVEQTGPNVEVLSRVPEGHGEHTGAIVAVRSGSVMATSFHPEAMPGEKRLHELFLRECVGI
ncbi:pyridoxal 5'-phosphate synthase glutaminase subunit PdxT [Corynebacterium sputi]|uniref:pyridoxal 5'-phosphate synthase glutaminase subunit PdxT n=1 Tax=Corynebacterium sputi TaxID=489915 RepID=UPI00041A935F|nr:pyridoxal 5'-phosphate synthase glutaminase subunit PdxT [Corynebacterium sputi]